MLADTIDDLEHKGLTRLSDGAVCLFPPGFTNREGEPLPLILRKSDGGYGYHVTDLATVRYWIDKRGMTDLLYVVGSPQAQHFQMVFAACRQAGYLRDENQAVHIGFGSILGEDGKTIRTRAGDSVKLADLLAEAVGHAADVIAGRSQLDAPTQADVARAVGLGAVKYADLSGDREKDYVFTWQKMLATDGNTSVYLQYANARVQSILRKAPRSAGTEVLLTEPAERALALKLLQLPAAVDAAVETYAPHKLCNYLYETAAVFTTFYERLSGAREQRGRAGARLPARAGPAHVGRARAGPVADRYRGPATDVTVQATAMPRSSRPATSGHPAERNRSRPAAASATIASACRASVSASLA